MDLFKVQIIETLAVIILLILLKIITRQLIHRIIRKFNFVVERKLIISNIVNLFIFIFAVVTITAIWSVDPKQFLVFITSILTVLGIAFFAQWSILSNVTSTLILFFNHPLKLGGYIKINDKDYPIEGHVEKISVFFLYIKTTENQLITIPSSVAMQKIIVLNESEAKNFLDK